MAKKPGFVRYSGNAENYMNGIRNLMRVAIMQAGKKGLTREQFSRWLTAGGYTYKESTIKMQWSLARSDGAIHDNGHPHFLP